MSDKKPDDQDEAQRRDAVIKRMLKTPPKPQHPVNEAHERRARPGGKSGGGKSKSRR